MVLNMRATMRDGRFMRSAARTRCALTPVGRPGASKRYATMAGGASRVACV